MAKRGRSQKANPSSALRRPARSYVSILYGALTLLVILAIAFIGVNFMRKPGTIGESGIQTQVTEVPNRTYIVQEGDSLWNISQKIYNDGYQWTKLAVANNIENPNQIEEGTKLVIPNIPLTITPKPSQTSPTPSETAMNVVQQTAPQKKITSDSYTVVSGDNLWTIALRAYGDPYRWVQIAQANHLTNPDLIFPGNHFIIPR